MPRSRPKPRPIQRTVLRTVRLAAKREFADEHSSFTVRVFISVLDELALQHSEAFFEWDAVDFGNAEVLIDGKGGDTR